MNQALRAALLVALCAAGAAGAEKYEPQPPLYLDRAKLQAFVVPPPPAPDSPAGTGRR
jgi:hypothetical protein